MLDSVSSITVRSWMVVAANRPVAGVSTWYGLVEGRAAEHGVAPTQKVALWKVMPW